MKIIHEQPTGVFYDLCVKKFGVSFDEGICFTYGDVCYAKDPIPDDLFVHEAVHVEQQKIIPPESWWDAYINDKSFRLKQEIPAYRAQYQFIKSHSSPIIATRALIRLARDLSGSIYGRMISYPDAISEIKNEKETTM